jgi:acyl-CoA synthetase (AMP-forming)/AMP-acid ligase II
LPAVLALLTLDGIARRVLLCPPDLDPVHIADIAREAEVNIILTDGTGPAAGQNLDGVTVIGCGGTLVPVEPFNGPRRETEWILFTSGTTSRPKMVIHTLATLARPLRDGLVVPGDPVWSTFYDIRRYGGLQILLRGMLGGGSLVLSQAGEPVRAFLARAGRSGVTHMSGTPSHWRRALMSGAPELMGPRYVRLSGEVADQTILNNLAAAFPGANIAHAFASTEAGVAFDVRDGKAGFPASLIGVNDSGVEMKVVDGSLRIRSNRVAARYLGAGGEIRGDDAFVDTGDMVELRDGRYYFVGRREGVINVGGQKVYPEEVESVINRHPLVQIARVRGRRSPITGQLVVADVVVRPPAVLDSIADELRAFCASVLPPHKVPAMFIPVASLDVSGAGKLRRSDA